MDPRVKHRQRTYPRIFLDGSKVTSEGEQTWHDARLLLKTHDIKAEQLYQDLLGNRQFRAVRQAVGLDGLAKSRERTWTKVRPIQRSLERASAKAERISEVSPEWKQQLSVCSVNLNYFRSDSFSVERKLHDSKLKALGVYLDGTSGDVRQNSPFLGDVIRKSHKRITRTLELSKDRNPAVQDTKVNAALLTARFLRAACPAWFASLTAEQVRRRVAYAPAARVAGKPRR